jgi:predicted CXXCH cytochrome family protein
MAGLLAVSGCSPETRYRTLSLFFDGVPDPAKQAAADKKRGAAAADTTKTHFTNHGPYAARMCDACHRADGVGLIMPVEDLCMNCHVLNIRKKYVHGPVASGGCRICHNPHGTGKPFLLAADPATFCFSCHDKNAIMAREVHTAAAGTQCTECHDPHGSDNEYLLR